MHAFDKGYAGTKKHLVHYAMTSMKSFVVGANATSCFHSDNNMQSKYNMVD